MASISLPLTFRAVGNEDLASSCVAVEKSIASLDAGQLLVRVTHASLNSMDGLLQRLNLFQLPLPLVLGFDFAGTVVAVGGRDVAGEGGDRVAVGTEVLGNTTRGGCFGQYLVVPPDQVVPRGSVPSRSGAAFGVAFITAYDGLELTLKVAEHRGKTILIPGAAGGVAHFAVQLAKRAGLRVIGTTSKPAGVALLKQLQVDLIIDYLKQDVAKEVLAFTGGQGADLVWDATYQRASLELSASLVARGGVWCMLGTAQQMLMKGVQDCEAISRIAEARGAAAVSSDAVSRGAAFQQLNTEMLAAGVRLFEEGSVKPVISEELPLEPAALQRALDDIRAGKVVGKVVVKVA